MSIIDLLPRVGRGRTVAGRCTEPLQHSPVLRVRRVHHAVVVQTQHWRLWSHLANFGQELGVLLDAFGDISGLDVAADDVVLTEPDHNQIGLGDVLHRVLGHVACGVEVQCFSW